MSKPAYQLYLASKIRQGAIIITHIKNTFK